MTKLPFIAENSRIAIVGSRNFSKLELISDAINQLPISCVIVSGGARGVDRTAEILAKKRGLQTDIYPADWDKYGKSAGIIRNTTIVDNANIVIAFWDGASRGTLDTIYKAKKKGIPVVVIKS